MGRQTMRVGGAFGITLLIATTVAAHEGHVVGTGFAASLAHAFEHALGGLVIGAGALALAWRLRRERRRATRVLVRRGDFS